MPCLWLVQIPHGWLCHCMQQQFDVWFWVFARSYGSSESNKLNKNTILLFSVPSLLTTSTLQPTPHCQILPLLILPTLVRWNTAVMLQKYMKSRFKLGKSFCAIIFINRLNKKSELFFWQTNSNIKNIFSNYSSTAV